MQHPPGGGGGQCTHCNTNHSTHQGRHSPHCITKQRGSIVLTAAPTKRCHVSTAAPTRGGSVPTASPTRGGALSSLLHLPKRRYVPSAAPTRKGSVPTTAHTRRGCVPIAAPTSRGSPEGSLQVQRSAATHVEVSCRNWRGGHRVPCPGSPHPGAHSLSSCKGIIPGMFDRNKIIQYNYLWISDISGSRT